MSPVANLLTQRSSTTLLHAQMFIDGHAPGAVICLHNETEMPPKLRGVRFIPSPHVPTGRFSVITSELEEIFP